MKRLPLTLFALIFLVAVPVIAADCPTLVQQALAATEDMCQTTGQNQACYGNVRLQAKPNPRVTDFIFDRPGDRVELRDIKSLQLSPMTPDTGEWGVALMHIQANLPATHDKNVMLLAFGDVAIENTAPLPTEADVQVITDVAVNVRWLPNVNAGAVAVLQPGQKVSAVERLLDSSWLRINLPDSGETGWVKGDLVESMVDLSTLNVAAGNQPNYRPMQAFTFSSGTNDEKCAEIPKDGLIIQTPEGAGEIRLWINQVMVKMGSTVYFQAEPGEAMIVTTLEGHATVQALGVTYTAVAGTSVRIPMDEALKPSAPPTLPESYQLDDLQSLPIASLERDIVIHEPLTEEAVAVVQQQQQAQNTSVSAVVANSVATAGNAATTVVDAAGNTVTSVVDATGSTVTTVVNAAGNTVTTVVNTAGNTVTSVVDSTGNTVTSVVDAVTGTTSGGTGGESGGGDDSDDGLIDDILDTVLDIPCLLLFCR